MSGERQISGSALGKHVGHAVEGHCRGLIRRLLESEGYSVLRQLPFAFPVNPDIVVLTEDNKIRCLGIVAYARDAPSTHKKFYRTRLEYQQILDLWERLPERFSTHFLPMVVLYGAARGWKDELIKDLEENCPPTLFLPQVLGREAAENITRDAFALYRSRWEEGRSDSREFVERSFADAQELSESHRVLLQVLSEKLLDVEARSRARGALEASGQRALNVRLPTPFHSRVRQGLSLASLFTNQEIKSWISSDRRLKNPNGVALESFVRRGCFLDVIRVENRKSITGSFLQARPRQPLRVVDGKEEYAPGRPDFVSWEDVPEEVICRTLSAHRDLPCVRPKVFSGGALDQIAGNWRGFCSSWVENIPDLLTAIKNKDYQLLAEILRKDQGIQAEEWQPSRGLASVAPLWGICSSALALLANDRSVFRSYGFRHQQLPDHPKAVQLSQALMSSDFAALETLFAELRSFCHTLLEEPLSAVATIPQPRLLSLDEPCSWVSAYYLAIVSNATHNPLCVLVERWLRQRFPDLSWYGWPSKRSVTLKQFFASHLGRVQWYFVGTTEDDSSMVIADVKSITANNWGNKSKEIYDRIAETRRALKAANRVGLTIGILDGDFDQRSLDELNTGVAYDEVFAIHEILEEITPLNGVDS